MNGAERAAAAVAITAAVREVSHTVEQVHRGVASRVRSGLAMLGPVATVPADVASGVTRLTYGIVRAAAAATGVVTAEAFRRATPPDTPALADTPRGAVALAVVGAAFGDHLSSSARTSPLAPGMGVRSGGTAVDPTDLTVRFPAATGSLGIMLHGLGGSEYQWGHDAGEALRNGGFTPLQVRYTTGLPIAVNGRALSELLDELVHAWPVPVTRIVLVGHSMGGLVARSACHQAVPGSWVDRVTDLVTLGSPHTGAPLERIADRALRALRRSQVAGPIAALGDRRSAGIKDLRYGAILPEHWGGRHPDHQPADTTSHVPLRPGVRHHAVAGMLGRTPEGVPARLFGDGMVPVASAMGRAGAAEEVVVRAIPGADHWSLPDHPAVAELLAAITDSRPAEVDTASAQIASPVSPPDVRSR
jgi:pimeloyl-ACP methyl ester carboxylesterase